MENLTYLPGDFRGLQSNHNSFVQGNAKRRNF